MSCSKFVDSWGISQLHGFLSNWFVFARLGPGDPLSTHNSLGSALLCIRLTYIHVPGRQLSSLRGIFDPRAFPSTLQRPDDRAWSVDYVLASSWR